jgi:hypothetical protein
VQVPDPVKITPREPEVKKPISIKESIEKNRAKLEAEVDPKALKAKEPAKEAKPAAKVDPKAAEAEAKAKPATEAKPADKTAERPRGEHGHFTADPNKTDAENETARKEAESKPAPKSDRADVVDHRTVPKRFNTNSIRTESGEMLPGVTKEDWDSVPDKLKIETHRVFREMEAGLNKHRDRSQKYETYAEFDDLAAKSNVDPKATLKSYVAIDRALHSGDARQITVPSPRCMKIVGVTPVQYAQAVLKNSGAQQQPNGQQPQQGSSSPTSADGQRAGAAALGPDPAARAAAHQGGERAHHRRLVERQAAVPDPQEPHHRTDPDRWIARR